jgi:hypothetical protein
MREEVYVELIFLGYGLDDVAHDASEFNMHYSRYTFHRKKTWDLLPAVSNCTGNLTSHFLLP